MKIVTTIRVVDFIMNYKVSYLKIKKHFKTELLKNIFFMCLFDCKNILIPFQGY